MHIEVGGEAVEWTEELKYLGYIVNSEGTCTSQIEYTLSKMPYHAITPTIRLNKYSNVDPRTVVNVARAYIRNPAAQCVDHTLVHNCGES